MNMGFHAMWCMDSLCTHTCISSPISQMMMNGQPGDNIQEYGEMPEEEGKSELAPLFPLIKS